MALIMLMITPACLKLRTKLLLHQESRKVHLSFWLPYASLKPLTLWSPKVPYPCIHMTQGHPSPVCGTAACQMEQCGAGDVYKHVDCTWEGRRRLDGFLAP